MTRPLLVIAALSALAACTGIPCVPAASAADDPVGRELARAVEAHPEDPDLRFALAAQLEATGDLDGAVVHFARLAEAFPERRPDVWLRLGRLLSALGRDAEAVPALERAIAADEETGAAHLHLGLALRRLGRHEEATLHFARAGEVEPELLPEAALLQALSRIDLGDERGAVPYLKRAVEVDPTGEAARSAQLLLHTGTAARERPPYFHFEWFGGYETDTNVTLDGSADIPNVSDQRNDARAVWGATLLLRPLHRKRVGLAFGVRYDQAEQEELSAFDVRRELAFASLRVTPHERVSLRLDGLATRTRLDHRRYQRTRSLRPSLLFALSERLGVTRMFASLEEVSYPEDPSLSNLDRDGWALGGGFDHFVPIPVLAGTWLSLGADFRRYDTDSERDPLLGFASPYDHDRWRASTTLRSQLPLGFEGEASFSWSQERYEHRSLLDALTDGGVGTLDPSTRLDHVLEGRFSLVRPVTRYAGVELRVQQIERTSNVDIYQYDRRIVGVYVKLHTP
jgi:tetratricopeptide (TPR) repeat protein